MEQKSEYLFDDVNPRRVPKPAKFSQVPVQASVPDVSLIRLNSVPSRGFGNLTSSSATVGDYLPESSTSPLTPTQTYSEWKARHWSHNKLCDLVPSSVLSDSLPRGQPPTPYDHTTKLDSTHSGYLHSQAPVKFKHNVQNNKEPESFIKNTTISAENSNSSSKYVKNQLSEVQYQNRDVTQNTYRSDISTSEEDNVRRLPSDVITSGSLVYIPRSVVIQQKESKTIASNTSSPKHKYSSLTNTKPTQSAQQRSEDVVHPSQGIEFRESWNDEVVNKHVYHEEKTQGCTDSPNRHKRSPKNPSLSISASSILQAQNTVFEKTSNILDQMFVVNQKQCQMLEEILQKVSGLQLQQDNFISQVSNATIQKLSHLQTQQDNFLAEMTKRCATYCNRDFMSTEKMTAPCENARFSNAVLSPRQMQCTGMTTQTSVENYRASTGNDRTSNKQSVGVMTDDIPEQTHRTAHREEMQQGEHHKCSTIQTESLTENKVKDGALLADLASVMKECHEMRSALKQHHSKCVSERPEANVDESLTLHGVDVLTIPDQPPSPLPSLHLDIQDYQESSDEDTTDRLEERSGDNRDVRNCERSKEDNTASWTFYDNVVGQVNKFLESPTATGHQRRRNGTPTRNETQAACVTPKKVPSGEAVRIATIEQIRKLGVSVYEGAAEIKEVSTTTRRVQFDSVMWPGEDVESAESSDTSARMNALALKYLKDDHLSELVRTGTGKRPLKVSNMGKKSTNMSLATQRYLERYKLLPSTTQHADDPFRNSIHERNHILREQIRTEVKRTNKVENKYARSSPRCCGSDNPPEKILDITTLKQQPKLL